MPNPAEATVPLYQQVHNGVFEQILSGELGPGAMLPSEIDIAAAYEVSPGTARKAISELERSGVVERKQGRGTFVTATTPETSLYHFFRLRRKDGSPVIPDSGSVSVVARTATAREAAGLTIENRSRVFEICRTRTMNGQAICREVCVLPARAFPGLKERDTLPNALYPLYHRHYGQRVIEADEKLRAVAASADIAEQLDIPPGTPVLQVERVALGLDGRPVEYRLTHFLADKFHYSVALR